MKQNTQRCWARAAIKWELWQNDRWRARARATDKHSPTHEERNGTEHIALCPSRTTFPFIWSRMSKYKITFSQLTSLYCAPHKCIHKIIVLWVKIDSQRKFFPNFFSTIVIVVFFISFYSFFRLSVCLFVCLSLSFRALVNYLVVKFGACVYFFLFRLNQVITFTRCENILHIMVSINLHLHTWKPMCALCVCWFTETPPGWFAYWTDMFSACIHNTHVRRTHWLKVHLDANETVCLIRTAIIFMGQMPYKWEYKWTKEICVNDFQHIYTHTNTHKWSCISLHVQPLHSRVDIGAIPFVRDLFHFVVVVSAVMINNNSERNERKTALKCAFNTDGHSNCLSLHPFFMVIYCVAAIVKMHCTHVLI